ncbi:hypothetical protein [Corallococcus llansteffanensis]|nr:hypothetical protein [Corallococcus llansteffanensis]
MAEHEHAFPWFPLAATDATSDRATITLGLRSADLHFREQVVPGIGRVWFLRQLCWPVAALALRPDLPPDGRPGRTAADIASGIEALACKLEFIEGEGSDSKRIIGVRAFTRDQGQNGASIWDYDSLRTRAHYVQNTYRQAAVRALGEHAGLGLASGSRYSSMVLTGPGEQLAQAYLSQSAGKPPLKNWLLRWIAGADGYRGPSVRLALSPEHASDDEREIIWKRLAGVDTPGSEKRRALAKIFLQEETFPDIEKSLLPALREQGKKEALQASGIALARSFGALFTAALRVLAHLTRLIEQVGAVLPADAAARKEIRRAMEQLSESAQKYHKQHEKLPAVGHADALRFALGVQARSGGELLSWLVSLDGQILQLSDGELHPGSLFRVLDNEEDATDQDGTTDLDARTDDGRTFRLVNLFSLVKDCGMDAVP